MKDIVKYTGVGALVMAFLVYVITINLSASAGEMESESVNKDSYFADFEMQGFDGKIYTEDILKGKKVTVFNGWAPWCGPCTAEMPELQELNDLYEEKGLQVLGVVADYFATPDSRLEKYRRDIEEVLEKDSIQYPTLLADEAFKEGPYQMMKNSFPCTWAVDEAGNLIEVVIGARDKAEWSKLFDKWLDSVD